MKFKEKVYQKPYVGDIVTSKTSEPRVIIRDTEYGKTKYALMSLGGNIATSWCDSIEDLLEGYEIKRIIQNDNLELVEI